METASLQVKFSDGSATKSQTYSDISVNSTDAQIKEFTNFLTTKLMNNATVISTVKIIRREID